MIHHPNAKQMRKFGSMRAAIIGSALGTKNVAVILVDFPASACAGCTSGSNTIAVGFLPTIQTYFNNMRTYFQEASYGAMDISFKYFGPNTATVGGDNTPQIAGVYQLAHRMEYYGCGDEGAGCSGVSFPGGLPTGGTNANGDYLIGDALLAARAGHGSTPDTGGLTPFDAVIVMHAGNGNETTNSNGDIWSIFYSQDTVITFGGGGFDEGDVVPATEASGITSPLGVMCHEFGHELGLPDEYNTSFNGGTSVVGNWEIMDSGPFDGFGANPAHPGAWDKKFLGWATPQTVGTRASVTIPTSEKNATGMVLINAPNGVGSTCTEAGVPNQPCEYFLVEYRLRSAVGASFDHNIPGDGLLIWHVDDSLTSSRGIAAGDPGLQNTVNAKVGTDHYGISIVTADGATISNSNQGDAGNAYVTGQIFTSPSSNNFAGQPSGVSLVNIAGAGTATMTADIVALAVSAGQSISKAVNYPNPAGKGYSHPSGEGHTTIQFQLTRPAQDYSINIYTLSADVVKKIGKDAITLNITRSSDLKWVYEYEWDLKNGDGVHVAPGVYLVLIRADGETKSIKTVVIR
jgi:M6 family metalloprotease-like protein